LSQSRYQGAGILVDTCRYTSNVLSRQRDLHPATKFSPLTFFTVNVLPTSKSQWRTPLLTLPRFNSFYFYFSSISHPIACTDLFINPFCIDFSHHLSFGHLNTHPIIDLNIEKFKSYISWDTKRELKSCSFIRRSEIFGSFHTMIR
jgi:hypothetical protein